MTAVRDTSSVVIIDDDPFDSLIIERHLRAAMADADVHVINDSRKALATFKEMAPDLLILDISMPHLSGLDILEAIVPYRAAPKKMGGSVVMLSGSTSSQDKKRAYELGADGYYVKPSSLSDYAAMAAEMVKSAGLNESGQSLAREAVSSFLYAQALRMKFALRTQIVGSHQSTSLQT